MRIPRQTGRSFQTKLDTDPTANWRLNDKTDHGDEVISASSRTVVLCHHAASWGDTMYCLYHIDFLWCQHCEKTGKPVPVRLSVGN